MDLTPLHRELMQAVTELQADSRAPSTRLVGPRLHALSSETGTGFVLDASPPWFGLFELAHDLDDEKLIRIHHGMATPIGQHSPASTVEQYNLEVTAEGQRALAGGADA